jgi:K+/H+ antiporter YhaU regulatory subunit KhtT
MPLSHDRQQIASHVQEMDGEHVKALVLDWLTATDASLQDFEKLLSTMPVTAETESNVYGELDETLSFHTLTETQMIEKSLEALEAYRRTGNGVPHEQVRQWADQLG